MPKRPFKIYPNIFIKKWTFGKVSTNWISNEFEPCNDNPMNSQIKWTTSKTWLLFLRGLVSLFNRLAFFLMQGFARSLSFDDLQNC